MVQTFDKKYEIKAKNHICREHLGLVCPNASGKWLAGKSVPERVGR